MIMKEGILEAPNEVFPLMTFHWEFFASSDSGY